MTTAFAPTHEIVFTPVTGAPRTILVALTDEGAAYTREEWESETVVEVKVTLAVVITDDAHLHGPSHYAAGIDGMPQTFARGALVQLRLHASPLRVSRVQCHALA